MVRVCWLSQNQCRCRLQLNRLCAHQLPTAGDSGAQGQGLSPARNVCRIGFALNFRRPYRRARVCGLCCD
nr:MAG TPA: hypothetical protein [Caudoviricetes sp.]